MIRMASLLFLVNTLVISLDQANEAQPSIGHRLLKAEYQVVSRTKAAPPATELQRRLALLDSIVTESAQRIQGLTIDNTTREGVLKNFQEVSDVLEERGFRLRIPTKLFWEALTVRQESKEAPSHFQYDCDTGAFIYLSVFEALDCPVVLVETPNHFLVRWRLSDTEHVNWDVNDRASYTDAAHRKGIPKTTPESNRETERRGFYLKDMSEKELIGYHLAIIARIAMNNGHFEQALELYNLAERNRPHKAPLKNNIAWAIATKPSLQNPESLKRARRLAKFAVAIDPHPNWIDTLAAVYAAQRQFEMAIQTEKAGHNNPARLKAYLEKKTPAEMNWGSEN